MVSSINVATDLQEVKRRAAVAVAVGSGSWQTAKKHRNELYETS